MITHPTDLIAQARAAAEPDNFVGEQPSALLRALADALEQALATVADLRRWCDENGQNCDEAQRGLETALADRGAAIARAEKAEAALALSNEAGQKLADLLRLTEETWWEHDQEEIRKQRDLIAERDAAIARAEAAEKLAGDRRTLLQLRTEASGNWRERAEKAEEQTDAFCVALNTARAALCWYADGNQDGGSKARIGLEGLYVPALRGEPKESR